MGRENYCPICGKDYNEKLSGKYVSHSCSESFLRAINAANTKAENDLEAFRYIQEPSYDQRLEFGFNMLSDDEIISNHEKYIIEDKTNSK